MKQQMIEWAEQAKALFPEDATLPNGTSRRQAIDEQLEQALENYDDVIGKTQAARFLGDMNAQARIAYRRKFQTEIVEIQ